jgi:hypothetical protein
MKKNDKNYKKNNKSENYAEMENWQNWHITLG